MKNHLRKTKRFLSLSDVRIHNEEINRILFCKGIKFEQWTYIQFRFNISYLMQVSKSNPKTEHHLSLQNPILVKKLENIFPGNPFKDPKSSTFFRRKIFKITILQRKYHLLNLHKMEALDILVSKVTWQI